ncbi:MAG: winged helix-turn-helix transcriptional regulator [Firmicutes bacterium]|nr:winged helix-turn-helix transcriptional regulator [Bacillota bacterium]
MAVEDKSKSIGRLISILHRHTQIYFRRELGPYGIGKGQFIFLAALFERDGVSQEYLSNRLLIDKGVTARAIQKLEEAGYVIREVDPDDKRVNVICLTKKALELRTIFKEVAERWTNMLTSDFSEEEKELALMLLRRMAENVAYLRTDMRTRPKID